MFTLILCYALYIFENANITLHALIVDPCPQSIESTIRHSVDERNC